MIGEEGYKQEKLPLIDFYRFDDIAGDIRDISKTPVFCATSRMVEQKGYDIAAKAILNLMEKYKDSDFAGELPVLLWAVPEMLNTSGF